MVKEIFALARSLNLSSYDALYLERPNQSIEKGFSLPKYSPKTGKDGFTYNLHMLNL